VGRFINSATSVVVSVADEKDDRFGEGWEPYNGTESAEDAEAEGARIEAEQAAAAEAARVAAEQAAADEAAKAAAAKPAARGSSK
jgi:hypothetical protein